MAARKRGGGSRAPAKPVEAPRPSYSFTLQSAMVPAVLLLVVALIAYANSFKGVFVLDDRHHIVDNDSITKFFPISGWLLDPRGIPRPLVTFTVAANFAIGALSTFGYHVVNFIVHILAGLTLFGIVRRTCVTEPMREKFGAAATPLAVCAALIWMVHPLQTQAVTYIIQRCESMMALFFLLTLYCVIRGFDSKRALLWHIGAALSAILGVMCKQVIVVAPLVTFIYDWLFLSCSLLGVLRRWKVHAGVMLSWIPLVILLNAMPETKTAGFETLECTPLDYARTQPGVLLMYLKLVVWPVELCLDYALLPLKTWGPAILPSLVILAMLFVTAWGLVRKALWSFVGVWFFLILAPTSSIMPIADVAVEHRMYLPLAGIVTGVVCGVYLLLKRWVEISAPPEQRGRRMAVVGVALMLAVIVVLTARTIMRNEDYATAYRAWSLAVQQNPRNPRAQSNLGMALVEMQKTDEAMVHYRLALEARPDYSIAHYNLGICLAEKGNLTEAVSHYEQVLAGNNKDVEAHNNLAIALSRQNKLDEAIVHYQEALKYRPNYAIAWNNLGNAFFLRNRFEDAKVHYVKALALTPDYADAHANLGVTLDRLGDPVNARKHLEEALRLNPSHQQAKQNLARLALTERK